MSGVVVSVSNTQLALILAVHRAQPYQWTEEQVLRVAHSYLTWLTHPTEDG
jgi:hypothetical protein